MKAKNLLQSLLLLLVVLCVSGSLLAQPTPVVVGPGGVAVADWYKPEPGTLFSDAGTTQSTDSSMVYQWNDVTGHGFNLIQASTVYRPLYSSEKIQANFNPTMTFFNDYMEFKPGAGSDIIDRADGTLYGAGYMNVVSRTGFMGFHASNDFPGLHTYGDQLLLFSSGGPGYQPLSVDATFEDKSYFVAGGSWSNGGGVNANYTASTVSLNGIRTDYNGNQMYNVNLNQAYNALRIGYDNNWGGLNGQLNEVMVFENPLTVDEMSRVETYLSIKYGTTLNGGLSDYISTAGTVVWDAGDNAGYGSNIAGIARDDAEGLFQKQSWSTNAGRQVLIGVDLANTNAANLGTLTDGQYLVWGDNGLAKTPSVPVTNIPGANFRFENVWKVQNTGGVGPVKVAWPALWGSIQLVQSSDPSFASGNTVTDMSVKAAVINGVTYNYAEVTLNDGEYFTIAAFLPNPGGISVAPAVWYRPDNVTPASWIDAAFNSVDLTGIGNITVNPGDGIHNFHPWTTGYSAANYFRFDDDVNPVFGGFHDTIGNYHYWPLTVFGAARPTTVANGAITGVDDDLANGAEPGFGVRVNGGASSPYFYRFGNGAVQTATDLKANLGETGIYMYQPPATDVAGTGDMFFGLNGARQTIQINSRSSVAGPHLTLGYSGWNLGAFPGDIQEVIWYKASLSAQDIEQVESYFAIKYGSSLQHDYLNADGVAIYDLTVNDGYTSNIAGIGRELLNGGLDQRQSRSNAVGKQILIGTIGIADNNASNETSLDADGQYLIWGDNGQPKTPAVAISNVPETNFRFASVWKVQNTGNVGTVRVAWPVGLTNLKLVQSSDPTFASGNTVTDMGGNTVVVNGEAYHYADVSFADGEFFTLAAYQSNPGGISVAPAVWYQPYNVDSVTWLDASQDTINLRTPANGLITVNPGDAQHNYHPWTTGYSTANYFNYDHPTNAVFGAYGDTTGNLRYTPLTVFGAARPTAASNGEITGIDNELTTGAEPGFGVAASGTTVKPRFYRFSNGVNQLTSGIEATLQETGVYMYQPPAATTGTGDLTLGLNGVRETFTVNARSSVAGPYLKIGYSSYALDVFRGDIQEVIWYKATLSASDVDQVETYFAIKYGTTLHHDYLGTDGSAIFDLTANDGYTANIAGIGRDRDNGGLDQRQSSSVTAGKQILIGTTGLADNNGSNDTRLPAEGQYLIWGDNGLSKAPSVAVTNVPGANFRFASIWKVQNTGGVGTVRVAWPAGLTALKLVQSSDPTFASGNTISDMSANTIEVNGVAYNYADVSFADGEYFTLAAFVQAPGGVVDGLLMWHRANDTVSTAGPKDQWMDMSINDRTLTQTNNEGYRPELHTEASYTVGDHDHFFNFNPFYYFDGTDDFFYRLDNSYFETTSSPGSAFGVWFRSDNGGYRTPYGWGDDDPNLALRNDVFYFMRDNGNGVTPTITNSDINARLTSIAWKGAENGLYLNVDGRLYENTGANIGGINSAGNFAVGSEGFDLNGNGNEVFQGGIAEVFAYNRDLQNATGNEKARVNTYLALKYGITLLQDDGDGVTDYIASDGTIVWDTLVNGDYGHNVAGIAYDYTSALDQRQSISENLGNQVLIGTVGLAATNAENMTGLTTDGQFLIWGDNGLTKGPGVALTGVSGTNYRFSSVWKVQNTGGVGTVRVAWPALFSTLKLIQSSDPTFATIGSVTDMTINTIEINGVTYNYADVTLPDGEYFTFAAFVQAPGGVADGLMMWHKANDTALVAGAKSVWADVSGNGRDVTQNDNVNNQPQLHTEASFDANSRNYFFNYNPFYYFDGSNDFFYRLNDKYFDDPQSPGSAFGVVSQSGAGLYRSAFGWGDDDPYFVMSLTTMFLTSDNNRMISQVIPDVNEHARMAGILWQGAGSGYYLNIDGQLYTAPDNSAAITDINTANTFSIGAKGSNFGGSGYEVFQGGIAEVFAYNRDLQNAGTNEKARINTYLAIKYGITFNNEDGTGASDYLASDGSVIWDATGNQTYSHNIAGIGADFASALDQRQSVSVNPGAQVVISTVGLAANNRENGVGFGSDGQFLVWGDNGEVADLETADVPFSSGGNSGVRMTRTWRMQNTGLDVPVTIQVPQAMVSANASAAYYLVTASDDAFSTNVSIRLLSEGTAPDTLTVNLNPASGQSYFTIARLDVVTDVTLKDFHAVVSGCEARVSWIGATESDFDSYELQSSTDAVNFQTEQTLAGKGSGAKYNANVSLRAATQYLRLKLVNRNGSVSYSDYITVKSKCQVGGAPIAYPNPATNKLTLAHLGVGSKVISLYNANGVRVHTETTTADNKTINVQNMSAGIYLVTITNSNGETVKLKVIIR